MRPQDYGYNEHFWPTNRKEHSMKVDTYIRKRKEVGCPRCLAPRWAETRCRVCDLPFDGERGRPKPLTESKGAQHEQS